MKKKLRVAIVGAGRMAGFIDYEVLHYPAIKIPYSHAAAYMKCEETEIVAVCATKTSSLERFRKKWGVKRGYLDYKEMILQENPDIVSVTTHGDLHARIAIFAASHGVRGIYCEKPIATSLEDADRVVKICRENDVKLIVGHTRRWHNGYINAKKYIRSGALGDLVFINTIHTGELFHTGTHNFDLINMFAASEPDFVQSALDFFDDDMRVAREYNCDFSGMGMVRYKNGISAFVHGRFKEPPVFDQEFVCRKGYIRVFNNGLNWEVFKFKKVERPFESENIVWENRPEISVAERVETPFDTTINSTTLTAVKDLVNAVKYNRPTSTNGEDALKALELAMAFVYSEQRGGARIFFPLPRNGIRVNAR